MSFFLIVVGICSSGIFVASLAQQPARYVTPANAQRSQHATRTRRVQGTPSRDVTRIGVISHSHVRVNMFAEYLQVHEARQWGGG